MPEKLGPIQLPKMPEERQAEANKRALADLDRIIEAKRVIAGMAQTPQWEPVKKLLDKMVEKHVADLICESDTVEIYRLQGAIRALSFFKSSPEDALKVVEKLQAKREAIAKMTP